VSTFATVITYGTFLIALVFIVGYAYWTRGHWRDSTMGWHLMAIASSEALVFGLLSLAHLEPALAVHAWFRWVYLIAVATIGLVTLWRFIILWIVYHPRRGRHESSRP
jgi:hypothetical protein